MDGGAPDIIYKACHGQHWVVTAQNNSQISCKMSAFRLPLYTENGMMCCKERHTLLLESFMTFPRYLRMYIRASIRIYIPLFGPHLVISTENNSQNNM